MRKQIHCNRKNDWTFLLAMLGFCAVVPHLVLSLLQMDFLSGSLSPIQIEGLSNFFVCQWIPFCMLLIAYLRLQKTDCFSLLPALCAGMIVLTFLPRYPLKSVETIALTIPLMLLVECSALLRTADRKLLRSFWFWSLTFPCVVIISCKACTWYKAIVSPFQMFPFPGILLFDVFRQQENQPPTIRGVLAMLPAVPVSLFLVTLGPMAQFQGYHLMCLGLGYAFVFLMLFVYNWDHWKTKSCQ